MSWLVPTVIGRVERTGARTNVHRTGSKAALRRRLLGIRTKVVVMSWLVPTIVGRVERAGTRTNVHRTGSKAALRRLLGVRTKVVVMSWLVPTVVGRVKRTSPHTAHRAGAEAALRRRLLGIRTKVVVMSRLVPTVIARMKRLHSVGSIACLILLILAIFGLNKTGRLETLGSTNRRLSYAKGALGRVLRIGTKVVIMTCLIPAVVRRMERALVIHASVSSLKK
ncbi:hypothetical protein [Paenibacillus sp. J2TS4]|uniref:hypothetical protein n=1 Tax=Paenibacillus sp. J2TS4 TaxID=2807194 RepID=UPI001B29F598|nr:hypothetical protein [Paenibacillus sp. J2TS4]GIP32887.1 hypothetical protein J2TS4_20970 [Paenibacillus sp. J2TS4]